jgi:predicted DsbA family dithiol-disulfide isomerase
VAVIHVSYYTDPACPWSWAAEPWRRRLQYEFGDELRFTYVMSGLARTIDRPLDQLAAWLDAAAESAMPVDTRLWLQAPPASSYPACLAVKAAAEQGLEEPLLRRLREGFAIGRRKLDNADALLEAARGLPALNLDRFTIDLGSHAIVEAFGADLDRAEAAARAAGAEPGGENARVSTPWLEFRGPGGEVHAVGWQDGPDGWRSAALAAGAEPSAPAAPTPQQALRSLGPLATPEIAAVCDLPGPRAAAELWRLAAEWQVRPQEVLGGQLWRLA